MLAKAALARKVPTDLRQLAAVLLKQYVKAHWQDRRPSRHRAACGQCGRMVGWEGAFTITTLALGLVVLFRDLVGPDFVFLGMLAALMASHIVSVEEGLEGFANEAPLTVAGGRAMDAIALRHCGWGIPVLDMLRRDGEGWRRSFVLGRGREWHQKRARLNAFWFQFLWVGIAKAQCGPMSRQFERG